jgi:hypothetical protein
MSLRKFDVEISQIESEFLKGLLLLLQKTDNGCNKDSKILAPDEIELKQKIYYQECLRRATIPLYYELLRLRVMTCELSLSFENKNFEKSLGPLKKERSLEIFRYETQSDYKDFESYVNGKKLIDASILQSVLDDASHEQWILLTFEKSNDQTIPIIHKIIQCSMKRSVESNDLDIMRVLLQGIPIDVWMCPWALDKNGHNPIQLLALLLSHYDIDLDKFQIRRYLDVFNETIGNKYSLRLVRLIRRILGRKLSRFDDTSLGEHILGRKLSRFDDTSLGEQIYMYKHMSLTELKVPLCMFLKSSKIDGDMYVRM